MRQGARGIARMAGIGTSGKHPQNTLRDPMHLLGCPAGSPPMECFEIPTERGALAAHPFLLPHTFFRYLYQEAQAVWISALRGGRGLKCRILGCDFEFIILQISSKSAHPRLAPDNSTRLAWRCRRIQSPRFLDDCILEFTRSKWIHHTKTFCAHCDT